MSRNLDRLRAVLAEMNQILDELEKGPVERPRKRPVAKIEVSADQKSIDAVRRKLRRGGFAA